MLSVIQSQMDWQKALDDMFETCGIDTRMIVRGVVRLICHLTSHVLIFFFVKRIHLLSKFTLTNLQLKNVSLVLLRIVNNSRVVFREALFYVM